MKLKDFLPAPPPYAPIPRFLVDRYRQSVAPVFPVVPQDSRGSSGPSTDELLAYQKREVVKNLLALEAHLLQKCKIGGKACDCCEKHTAEVEKLAEEAELMGDGAYTALLAWLRQHASDFSPSASASGAYDEWYPKAAVEVRTFRKGLT